MTTATALSRPSPVKLTLAYGAVYFIWGSAFLAIRLAVETIPPFMTMGLRSLVAGAVLILIARWRGAAWPNRRQIVTATILGTLFFVTGQGVQAVAMQRVDSGVAAVSAATVPLWIPLLTWMIAPAERPSRRVLVGIVLGFIGVAMLFGLRQGLPIGGISALDAVLLIESALSWAVATVAARHMAQTSSPTMNTALPLICAGAILMAVSGGYGEFAGFDPANVALHSLAGLGFMTVFGVLVAFSAYMWLVKVAPPARVATYAFVNPVVAVLLGWAVVDEPLTAGTLASVGVIIAAVAITVTARRAAP